FGPDFVDVTVTSAAVSLDGSRVAVAVAERSGSSRIDVVPLPGHGGQQTSWIVSAAGANGVTGLSWAPDGRHLSYVVGPRALTGVAGNPAVVAAVASVTATPNLPRWADAMNAGPTCVPDAVAWLGRSGRFAVLSECASTGTVVYVLADASTGAAQGEPIVVAHQVGCGSGAIDPSPSGNRVLISYCGTYLLDHGKLTKQPVRLTAAALSG